MLFLLCMIVLFCAIGICFCLHYKGKNRSEQSLLERYASKAKYKDTVTGVEINMKYFMSENEFRIRFSSLTKDIADVEIAVFLQISKPTVQRWKDGVSCVHPFGRETIIASLPSLRDQLGLDPIEHYTLH